MMLPMNPVACRVSISRTIPGTILFALLLALPAQAKPWDSTGAEEAFQEASQKRSEISQATQPSLSLYLECAKTYRKVHLRDPHYAHTGAAIYEEGLLYQEMGDRFSDLEFYKTAARRFELLIKDYGRNRNCPDALIRLGDIYLKHLKDESAAQNVYQILKTQYKSTDATRKLAEKEVPLRPPSEPSKIVEAPRNTSAAQFSQIQSVRHWSTGEYTRVIIDMNSNAKYIRERLSRPERIYFDVLNAKLGRDLQAQTIPVADEFLTQIRIARKSPDTIRIVLDLAETSDYSISELYDPFRIVVDLYKLGSTNAGLIKLPPEPKPAVKADIPKAASKNDSVVEHKASKGKAESLTQREAAMAVFPAKDLETKPKQPPRAITELDSSPSDVAKPASVALPTEVAKVQKPLAESRSTQKPAEPTVQANAKTVVSSNPVIEARAIKPAPEALSTGASDKKAEGKPLADTGRQWAANAGLRILPSESESVTSADIPKAASKGNSVLEDKTGQDRTESLTQQKSATVVSPAKPIEINLKQPPRAVTELHTFAAGVAKPGSVALPTEVVKAQKPPAELKSAQKPAEPPIQSDGKKTVSTNPIMNARVTLPPLFPAQNPSSMVVRSDPKTPPTEAPEKKAEAERADLKVNLPLTSNPKAAPLTSRGDRTLTRMLGLKISRIVIDPGHGGHDLGSAGPGGLLEKDLVLSLAIELQKLLQEKLGAEVILTRYDDTFVSLEERTAIANQYRADLFISIHANSSRTRLTSGVETYYLDFAKTQSEREIAARENATAASNINELENLIKKIAQADKAAESRELALIVQKSLYSGAKKAIPSTQNRGVRSAPFVVLIGAKMPSILAEVAFLSNPRVEKLLKRSTNQAFLVRALFSGIEDYAKTLGIEIVQNQVRIK